MRRLLATAILAVVAACGDAGTGTPAPPATASVTVTLGQPTVERGGQTTATATARDGGGHAISAEVTWSSSNPAIATIDASGKITAVLIGSSVITATVAGKSGSVVVFVIAPAVEVQVSIAPSSLFRFGSAQALALVSDRYGTLVPSTSATWTSSDPSVATVTRTGVVTLVAAGVTTLRATVGSSSGAYLLTVPPVTGVSIGGSGRAKVGDTTRFAVWIMNGPVAVVLPVTWSVADPTAATITGLGTVVFHRAGMVMLRATVGGITDTREIEAYDWTTTTSGGSVRVELPVHEDPWEVWVWVVWPTLELSCQDGVLGARINAPWTGGTSDVSIQYTTDWYSPTVAQWRGGTNTISHPGATNADVRGFLLEIMDSAFLRVEYTPWAPGGAQELLFRLANATPRIQQVLEACP